MEKLTYRQAFDKITEAYIKDEIRPMKAHFCFCGTLANNDSGWQFASRHEHTAYPYTVKDFGRMEAALFSPFTELEYEGIGLINDKILWDGNHHKPISVLPNYEERLFQGMCAALEVLKNIHKSRGENVEDFQFTKRQLKTCI